MQRLTSSKSLQSYVCSRQGRIILYGETNLTTKKQSLSSTHTTILTRSSSSSPSSHQQKFRHEILNASLNHVHQHGWTEEAIAQGVLSSKYPPTYIGMLNDNYNKPSDLINFFMEQCNAELKAHLMQKQNDFITKGTTHEEFLKYAIQYRLEMVVPFAQSQRWHEGMALGATPYNAPTTASLLDALVSILEEAMMKLPPSGSSSTSPSSLNPLERSAIGAVYITTELHLLADTSTNYKDTWSFLYNRIHELNYMAVQKHGSSLGDYTSQQNLQNSIIAATAVATSLGGAVISLINPAAKVGVSAVANTFVPQIMNFMSFAENSSSVNSHVNRDTNHSNGGNHRNHGSTSTSTTSTGTMVSDYDVSDLPPFESEGNASQK
mmetsp:Transcript_2447/g.3254  ORF Transcript_2447/g.3254 Transcript_2447/m.3254 type:complete len:379 (+) Transcript_2447:214-1350(+)